MDLLCRSSFNAGMLSTDFFSVGSGVLSRTETIMGHTKGFHALHRSLVEASRTMAIKFHHTARYKNGTSSQAFFAFPSLPYRALQCDRSLVITMFSSLFAPFTAVTRVQIPSGTPNLFRNLRAIVKIFAGKKGTTLTDSDEL